MASSVFTQRCIKAASAPPKQKQNSVANKASREFSSRLSTLACATSESDHCAVSRLTIQLSFSRASSELSACNACATACTCCCRLCQPMQEYRIIICASQNNAGVCWYSHSSTTAITSKGDNASNKASTPSKRPQSAC